MAITVKSASLGKGSSFVSTPEGRVGLFFFVTGLLALSAGIFLGPVQALNYANIDLYKYNLPFLRSYYQGLTLHGVLNVLVFTTFFNCGVMLYLPARELKRRPNMILSWTAYGMMVGGLVIAGIAIITNTSSVLYTFYPPLQGHWGFYLGAAMLVVGSLVVAFTMWLMWYGWKQDNPGAITPLVTYMSLMTWLMWGLAALGLSVSVVVFLLPWSLGWRAGVDPLLARTLFWYTGHPIVYFWLLPAYISWYAFVPKQAGGKLISDPLARLAFVFFLLFSTPVGFHHQFSDPGIPAAWKLVHSVLTMFVGIPSLLTAFSIAASLEYAGRKQGGKGLFGWIPKLPWKDASFTSHILAMGGFVFGGAGGIVNASFNLNAVIHNTAWVPGHFHLTVGTAVTMTFMGMTYWLIPHLTGRALVAPKVALISAWTWFIGMLIFGFGMHWQGLLGVPRRAHISNLSANLEGIYANAQIPMIFTGISGVILLISGLMFFYVFIGTLCFGKHLESENVPEIPFTAYVSGPEGSALARVLERVSLWFAAAVILVLFAYAPTLIYQFNNMVPVQGFKLW